MRNAFNAMDSKICRAQARSMQRHQSLDIVRETPSVREESAARNVIIAVIIFVAAHLALLVGVTIPEKFVFDEVHYVPAARQMLEPDMSQPMLNTMHPPLAKQLIALSIRSFGDGPLGWRYPAVLFGSLVIVAVYLCGLALFASEEAAIASALLAFFNQMVFVQSRIAMLDIFALARLAFVLSAACKWSGLFALATAIVIVAVIRLMQGWGTRFADGNSGD